jgi:hypothetical protein
MQQFFLMFTVMNLTDFIIKYIFPLQFAKFWTPISRTYCIRGPITGIQNLTQAVLVNPVHWVQNL